MRTVLHNFMALALILSLAGCDQKKATPVATSSVHTSTMESPSNDTWSGASDTSFTAESLYQLLAPVALFPDRLLAQVLAASTTPDDVAAAEAWRLKKPYLSANKLEQALSAKSWPPAVKALAAFPDVLNQMAQNLPWTRMLGAAYNRSPTDVMNAVQVLRQRAAQSGALKNTQQQVIIQPAPHNTLESGGNSAASPVAVTRILSQPPQTIIIQPTQPGVVYVPVYNTAVYGNPPVVYYPGYTPPSAYSTGDIVATGLISFTAGVMVGSMINDNWGWNSWNTRWGGNPVVLYNNRTFVNRTVINRNRTDWQRNTFGPGPVSPPHFATARNTFTTAHTATVNGRHINIPEFDPRHRAPQFVPRSISPHMPQQRNEHNSPRREGGLPPPRVRAPGPVRLSPELQKRIEREWHSPPGAVLWRSAQTHSRSPAFTLRTPVLSRENPPLTTGHLPDAITRFHRF
ncbi:DUF3300 domain-containing protein [Enterobacter cloacae]|uniref:DUF3300 domain-containing protein n=1 Tax=Enterobacter cloacae TaxID=550 RepID=UPI0034A51A42